MYSHVFLSAVKFSVNFNNFIFAKKINFKEELFAFVNDVCSCKASAHQFPKGIKKAFNNI